MLTLARNDNCLTSIEKMVEASAFMRHAVMELEQYDNTLVALTSQIEPKGQVRNFLEKVWNGPVEVYCASEHMVAGVFT